MHELLEQLDRVKKMLAKARLAQRNMTRQENATMPEAPFPTPPITQDVALVIERLKEHVLQDSFALKDLTSSKATLDESDKAEDDVAKNEAYDQKVQHSLQTSQSPYAEDFYNKLNVQSSLYYLDEENLKNPSDLEKITGATRNLYLIMANEATYMYDHMGEKGYSIAIIQKIEKAMSALASDRLHDTLLILKDAKRDDPHNRHIAFILSQALYFKVHQGQTALLPQAREEAKKSCVFTEKFDELRLLQYRYHYAVAEFAVSKERCIEMLREYFLLSPESIISKEGLRAHACIHLKAWLLLSELPIKFWDNFEYTSLLNLIRHTCGGTVLYVYLFRGKLIEDIQAKDKNIYPDFYELEQGICLSIERYGSITAPITKIESQIDQSLPWTLYQRYLGLFLSYAPTPSWDEIMLNVSLDGRGYETAGFPDKQNKGSGLINFSYWGTWAHSLTPYQDIYTPHILPTLKIAEELAITKELDKLLKELEDFEVHLFPDTDEYDLVLIHMPSYAYKSFMQLSSVGASTFRAPREQFFTPYYRSWCTNEPMPSPLPSEIVRAQAEKGGFISLEEAVGFFDGAVRILPDKTHGLKARINNVLEYMKKQEAQKEHNGGDALGHHLKEFWWLYFGIVPLAIFTFIIILVAGSGGNPEKVLMITLGTLLGGGLLLFLLFTGGKKK